MPSCSSPTLHAAADSGHGNHMWRFLSVSPWKPCTWSWCQIIPRCASWPRSNDLFHAEGGPRNSRAAMEQISMELTATLRRDRSNPWFDSTSSYPAHMSKKCPGGSFLLTLLISADFGRWRSEMWNTTSDVLSGSNRWRSRKCPPYFAYSTLASIYSLLHRPPVTPYDILYIIYYTLLIITMQPGSITAHRCMITRKNFFKSILVLFCFLFIEFYLSYVALCYSLFNIFSFRYGSLSRHYWRYRHCPEETDPLLSFVSTYIIYILFYPLFFLQSYALRTSFFSSLFFLLSSFNLFISLVI